MNADQIRKVQNAAYETILERSEPIEFDQKIQLARNDIFYEIAAQLAELNINLRAIFHVPDMPDSFKGLPERFAPNAHLKIDKLD